MKAINFFVSIVFLLTISCNGGTTSHMGEIQTSKILSTQLEEQELSQDCRAFVTLADSDDIPTGYTKAELYIADTLIGEFTDGVLSYIPETFGDVDCTVRFTLSTGLTENINDTLKLYIETWYFEAKTQENGDSFLPVDSGDVVIFTKPRARGNDDILFMYYLRIPYGKELKFTPEIVKVTDSRPIYNTVLEMHFRTGDEYAERLTEYAGEEYKHFDTDSATWADNPLELESGVHTVYLCPNAKHDLSLLTVYHSGDKTGSFSAYFKSIDYESLGL